MPIRFQRGLVGRELQDYMIPFEEWPEEIQQYYRYDPEMAPWLAIWPGVCLTVVVYSLNMFGDAVRDLLDPSLKGGTGSYGAAV